jgi:AcrR family transcriptional regulator
MSPRARFERLAVEKQDTILEAAAIEFAAAGFKGASLNKIIERTGFSKGAVYYYFDDKGDLYDAVVERALAKMIEWMGDVFFEDFEKDSFWTDLERWSLSLIGFLINHPGLARILRHLYSSLESQPQSRTVQVVFHSCREWTIALVERGQKVGTIRKDLPKDLLVETLLAVGMVSDRWVLYHLEAMNAEPAETARLITDLFRRIASP